MKGSPAPSSFITNSPIRFVNVYLDTIQVSTLIGPNRVKECENYYVFGQSPYLCNMLGVSASTLSTSIPITGSKKGEQINFNKI